MIKKEYRLISVAIITGIVGLGLYFYMESEDPFSPEIAPIISKTESPSADTRPTEPITQSPLNQAVETVSKPIAQEKSLPGSEYVDPVVAQQKKLVEDFKNKIQLDLDLPPDLNFAELDVEGNVAAMEGVSPAGDRKMVILAAPMTASPETIASYLQEQKVSIPSLADHDFKISGKIRTIPGPEGSGISSIKIIPGGSTKGTTVYAAHLERSDKKGSYVFIMRASPSYFDKYDGDMDNMLANLSAK